MNRQIRQVDGERARSELNDLACRTVVDRVLDVGEVVPSSAERVDRRAERRPVRDATDGQQTGVLPVGGGVVVGRYGRRRREGCSDHQKVPEAGYRACSSGFFYQVGGDRVGAEMRIGGNGPLERFRNGYIGREI